MRRRPLLPLLLVLSSSPALAQPVEDIQEPAGVLVPVATPGPCDEHAAPCLRLQAPQLVPIPVLQPKPPWQLHISLAVTSGVLAASQVFGADSRPAAYLGGDLRLLWSRPGKRWGLGLRISGSKSLGMSNGATDASGAEVGFLFDVYNFWVSTGVGFAHYAGASDGIILPEGFVAVGYDIPLGSRFALRLSASASTLLITARAQLGGGLVVRF